MKGDICIVFDALKKMEETKDDTNGEDMETMKKQDACFRMPIPKKYIGLHSFSRRLYRDVPDLFDILFLLDNSVYQR